MVWRSSALDDGSPADVAITQSVEQPAAGTAAPRPAQPTVPAPPATNGPVVLTAAEDVWLKIDEAGGASLYMGTLKAGQSYQLPAGAQAPRLRTARANVLRVTVGTTPIPPLGPPETTISNVSLAPADLVARAQGRAPQASPATP